MKKHINLILSTVIILILFTVSGCNLTKNTTESTNQVNQRYTEAAQTVMAELTKNAPTITVTPIPTQTPTNTLEPTPTTAQPSPEYNNTIEPTNAPKKCYWAYFLGDITYPDNTEVAANTEFIKTWRLQNIGSCNWDSTVKLVFYNGDKMGAEDVQITNGTIAPNETIDISITLTSPNDPGTYQSNFYLQTASGEKFGIGDTGTGYFYVKIIVPGTSKSKTVTPTDDGNNNTSKVDLEVTKFTLNPSLPVANETVTVSVTIVNTGNIDADSFTTVWYPNMDDSTIGCSWELDVLEAKGKTTLTCEYDGYPKSSASIITKVITDVYNDVKESDETDNYFLLDIKVE